MLHSKQVQNNLSSGFVLVSDFRSHVTNHALARHATALLKNRMSMQLVLLFVIFCDIAPVIVCQDSSDEEMSYSFEPEERFLDIFPLSSDNFTDSVMKSPDAWIVIFHSGQLKKSWKSMAVNLRGVVWVGMVDTRYETDLLKRMVRKLRI